MQKKKALLLMNLGSPESTSVKDVRKYLNEFLMDPKVIDKPWLARLLLVKGIITPFRAPKSAHAYETVWTKEGSPLIVLTKQLQAALKELHDMPIEITMRYGNPHPRVAFENLLKQAPDIDEVILFPLYPHYAMSSYETAVEYVKKEYNDNRAKYKFTLTVVPQFYNHPDYIQAMADAMQPYLQQDYDHLLFSYHGIPARHLHGCNQKNIPENVGKPCSEACPASQYKNCYRYEVYETTRLLTEKLGIPADKFSLSFQSRLGKGWLEPFTDKRLEAMPAEGIKKLLIVSPAFVSDCLETLEELAIGGKESFIAAGGESYTFIPCMNTNPTWVDAIGTIAGITVNEKVLAS